MNDQLNLFPQDRDSVILDFLEQYGLPPYVKPRIIALLEGKLSESTLICCNSGCNICSEIIYECLQSIKQKVKDIE